MVCSCYLRGVCLCGLRAVRRLSTGFVLSIRDELTYIEHMIRQNPCSGFMCVEPVFINANSHRSNSVVIGSVSMRLTWFISCVGGMLTTCNPMHRSTLLRRQARRMSPECRRLSQLTTTTLDAVPQAFCICDTPKLQSTLDYSQVRLGNLLV